MKLVVAVVQTEDADQCCDALTSAGYACTRVQSAGAFLDSHNATLFVGIDDLQADEVLEILRRHARRRVAALNAPASLPAAFAAVQPSVEVEVGGATVFILPLERFEKV